MSEEKEMEAGELDFSVMQERMEKSTKQMEVMATSAIQ